MFGLIVLGVSFAIFAGLAAHDVVRARRRRKAWSAHLSRHRPPRMPSRLCWLTPSGAFFPLTEVARAQIRQTRVRTPFTGIPVWCAQDERGAWLLWPSPDHQGEVVERVTICTESPAISGKPR